MANWNIKAQYHKLNRAEFAKFHPVIAQLLQLRGITEPQLMEQFLLPDYGRDLHDPLLFVGMGRALELIGEAKRQNHKVAIFGDYDADGVTSAVILQETLNELGLETLVYLPDKKSEGYGLNLAAVEKLAGQNVKLLITVDCGITNVAEVARAKELGMRVIVTDHHKVPMELPPAEVLLNPKLADSYPFAELAGVGVAFKLAVAIYQKFLPAKIEQAKWLLDLVALGTIADCVPLLNENRLIVKYGLLVLAKTKRSGLQELYKVGRMDIDQDNLPDVRKVAFQIAPRINAAGRVAHANLAYDLLAERDVVKARSLALELDANNLQRQKMTEQVVAEVRVLAQNLFKDKKYILAVGEIFPLGIVGLVAGKIAEEFGKPTVLLQKEAEVSRGSLRSIAGLDIMEVLNACQDLLLKFGGHAQAAGLTLENSKLEEFYARFGAEVEKRIQQEKLEPELNIDLEVSSAELDFALMNGLKQMQPFGEGNTEPLFLTRGMEVVDFRLVGNGEKHLKLSLKANDGSPKIFDAIFFGAGEKIILAERGQKLDVVYNLQENNWNGNSKLQLQVWDLKVSA